MSNGAVERNPAEAHRITISAEVRDLLLDQISNRIHGIDDLRVALEHGKTGDVERLAREYSDDLQLVCEDLGWGETGSHEYELTLPAEVLRRVLSRHCSWALHRESSEASERIEMEQQKARNEQLVRGCKRVLAELGLTATSTGCAEV